MARDPQTDAVVLSVTGAAADLVADAAGGRAAAADVAVHVADGGPRPAWADLVVELTDDPAAADYALELLNYAEPALAPAPEPDPPAASGVLFIAGDSGTPATYDQAWIDLLGGTYTVTVADEGDAAVADGYAIVVIGPDCAATPTAAVAEYAAGTNLPCLHLQSALFDEAGYSDSGWTSQTNQTQLTYQDDTYLAWPGETVGTAPTVTTSGRSIRFESIGSLAAGVVEQLRNSGAAVSVGGVIPPGGALIAGNVGRAVGFAGLHQMPTNLTATGEALGLALVEMVLTADAA